MPWKTMPAFILIGAGLDPRKHLTSEAIAALRSASRLFAESYTSVMPEGWERIIETLSGKRVEILDRRSVEEGEMILSACKDGDVAMLVPGDALAATTHVQLIEEAEKRGFDVKLVPGISIITVVPGLLGLQGYKFGKTVSLPRWRKGFEPTSPLDGIVENLKRGLHTLVLLDTEPEPMTARESATQLSKMIEVAKPESFKDTIIVCAIARACFDDQKLACVSLKELASIDLGPPPHTLVVPGELHFVERERLEKLRVV